MRLGMTIFWGLWTIAGITLLILTGSNNAFFATICFGTAFLLSLAGYIVERRKTSQPSGTAEIIES